jgi:hypothetical protein
LVGLSWRSFRVSTRWWPLVAGFCSAAAMAVRLFLPHPVGMANNGDAQRLLCQIDADAGSAPRATAKWMFVRLVTPSPITCRTVRVIR